MTTDSRKAQLEVGADASGVVRALDSIVDTAQTSAAKVEQAGARMAAGLDDLPQASDAAAKKVARDTDTMIASIQRATAAANAGGRGTAGYYQQLATSRGLDVSKITPYLDELAKAQAATQTLAAASTGVTSELNKSSISAGQMAAALRGLPAQVTDIVTSLQGGQKPLTVLFQQGGQIKDQFGGIGNAVSGVGRYLLGLLNPLSLSAAGLAALAFAYEEGSKEAEAFNRTLILSGSAAGETTGQLMQAAAAIRATGAATQGRAAEVLNDMASSAGIGAQNMTRFAAAALQLERSSGPAADATVKAFKDLAKAPLEASQKLNEQYNYLTPAVYEQIRALTELGKTSQAAQVAQEAYYTAINSRVPQLEENLGTLQRAWRVVAETAKSAWDHMLDIGRATTPEQAVDKLKDRIAELQRQIASGADNSSLFDAMTGGQSAKEELASLQAQLATEQRKAAAAQQEAKNKATTLEATKALAALDQQSDQYLPRRLQMEKELAQLRETAAKALAAPNLDDTTRSTILAEQRSAERGIREKYDPGYDQVQAQNELATIQRQLGLINDAYANAQRVLDAYHAAGLVSDQKYYASRAALIEKDRENTIAGLQAEIDATTKADTSDKLTTAQHAANAQKILDLQASISKAGSKAATEATLSGQEQASAIRNVAIAYDQARVSAQNYLDQIKLDEARGLQRISLGAGAQQQLQGRDQITDRFDATRKDLQQQIDRLPKDSEGNVDQARKKDLEDLLALQDTFERASLTSYDDYTQKRLALEGDWTTGAAKAWNDWSEQVANVAQQTNDLFKGMFDDLTSELLDFVQTGHLSFGKFVQDAVTQIEKSGIQYALQQLFKYLASLGSGSNAASVGGQSGGSSYVGLAASIGTLLFSAKGNAFSASAQLEAYRNSVVTKPTVFAFASGGAPNVGVMGEKSNSPGEAIMPLTRTRSGDLAVKAVGQQTTRQIITNQTFIVPGAIDRRTQSQVAISAYGAAQRAARRA